MLDLSELDAWATLGARLLMGELESEEQKATAWREKANELHDSVRWLKLGEVAAQRAAEEQARDESQSSGCQPGKSNHHIR